MKNGFMGEVPLGWVIWCLCGLVYLLGGWLMAVGYPLPCCADLSLEGGLAGLWRLVHPLIVHWVIFFLPVLCSLYALGYPFTVQCPSYPLLFISILP